MGRSHGFGLVLALYAVVGLLGHGGPTASTGLQCLWAAADGPPTNTVCLLADHPHQAFTLHFLRPLADDSDRLRQGANHCLVAALGLAHVMPPALRWASYLGPDLVKSLPQSVSPRCIPRAP